MYDKAFRIELKEAGLKFISQPRIKVFYKGNEIGVYIPDILVEDCVLIENKAAITLIASHEDQLRNALKASNLEVGLLFNFGLVPQFKRKVVNKEFKFL